MVLPSLGPCSRHFRRLATLKAVPFALRVGLESVAASFVVGMLLIPVLSETDGDGEGIGFVDGVVLAPLLATLLLQTIPVRITQYFSRNFRLLVLVGW